MVATMLERSVCEKYKSIIIKCIHTQNRTGTNLHTYIVLSGVCVVFLPLYVCMLWRESRVYILCINTPSQCSCFRYEQNGRRSVGVERLVEF